MLELNTLKKRYTPSKGEMVDYWLPQFVKYIEKYMGDITIEERAEFVETFEKAVVKSAEIAKGYAQGKLRRKNIYLISKK